MVDRKQIEEFASEIARQFSPEKIILFGSQARGTATDDSDVDMLVMMNFEGRRADITSKIRKNIPFNHALDLLVRKTEDVKWRIEQNDWFLQDVMKEGIVLYEAANT